MSRKQIRYTTTLLLVLYVGYYACVSLFVHTHIYNGVVYIHSHPYTTTDAGVPQEHQHTSATFFALNQISDLASNQAESPISLEIIRNPLIVILKEYRDRSNNGATFVYYPLRAPPANRVG